MFAEIEKEIEDTFRFRFVIKNFVSSTLKLRYRKTILGFFWSVLGPMMHYFVIGFVFSQTMRGTIPNYTTYMFAGALIYNMISSVILRSPFAFLNNEHYIKKVYIPKLVFVLDIVCVEVANFFLAFLALLVLGSIFQKIDFSLSLISIPMAILLGALFSVGISCYLSVAGVFFRDLTHIIPVFMQAVFFATPVLYDISQLPDKVSRWIKFSPFFYYVEIFRLPIYAQQFPPLQYWLVCCALSFTLFFSGLFFMKKFDNKIVFKL